MRWLVLAGAILFAAGLGVAGGYWLSEQGTFSASVNRSPAFDAPSDHGQDEHAGHTGIRGSGRCSTTGTRWVGQTPRRCRRRTPWGWTTSRSTPTRRRSLRRVRRRPISMASPPRLRRRRKAAGETASRSTTAIRWACRTPRRCRRKTRWGWTTSRSSPTTPKRRRKGFVKISPERVQMIGVRSEAAVAAQPRPPRPRGRKRPVRRTQHLRRLDALRGLDRTPPGQHHRAEGAPRRAAHGGLQPGPRARPAGVCAAPPIDAGGQWRHGPGDPLADRGRRAAPALPRLSGGRPAAAARRFAGAAGDHDPLAGLRDGHREGRGSGHAVHAGRSRSTGSSTCPPSG